MGNNDNTVNPNSGFLEGQNSAAYDQSIKQYEVNEALATIGKAEREAEEELAKLKLTNLIEQQKAKKKQLDRLFKLEDESIRKLAEARRTLSEKQFKLQKIKLDKELKQVKDAVEELLALEKDLANSSSKKPDAVKSAATISKEPATSGEKSSENTSNKELVNLVGSIDQTLTSLHDALIGKSKEKGSEATSTAKDIKDASTNRPQGQTTGTNSQETGTVVKTDSTAGAQSPVTETESNPQQAELKKEHNFTDGGLDSRDKVDLGIAPELVHNEFNTLLGTYLSSAQAQVEALTATGKEVNHDTASLDVRTTDILNKVFAQDNKGNYTASQSSFDAADSLIESINSANKAEEKVSSIKVTEGASPEKIAEVEMNQRLFLAKAEHELRKKHAETEWELTEKRLNAQAKANELITNAALYHAEAREAREIEIAENQTKLQQERLKTLGEIEANRIHRKALLDHEAFKKESEYLAEYQQMQLEGFTALTENMTKEEYVALRKREAAIEEAQKKRDKTAAARQKALDIIKGKGTLQEKKDQLKNHIKKEAAEKDWSGYGDKFQMREIKDDMSEEDKKAAEEHNKKAQEAREQATAATMAVNAAAGALADFAQKLSGKTDEIAKVQAQLDTRLQGSIKNLSTNPLDLGSYGRKLQREAKWIAGASPYMSQETLVKNMQGLVDKGISYNIKQRAFLMTISEKIATTFDAADGTLLRLIRIQQQDTTAGRLGMESALNSFLNTMYETSEYLTDVANSVRGSLEEMQALMEGKDATELEYQVQKWMGSLYSVGMSQEAVQSIAQTFGQIASGDVSGLTGNGTGNLLIMAANEAGMSIADILQDGLKADETNKLMQAMVNYLAEIAETSSDSKVVQQQLANVYGIKASDLRAATNLSDDLKLVSASDKSYFGMMMQLNNMMNTLALRTSIGEGLANMWGNIEYTMAASMAANPISYLLPKLSKMLKDTTGGIDLPFINVLGFGVDLNTTVSDLMSLAAMAPAVLGSLGPVITGLTDLVNPLAGTTMLVRAGINPFEGMLEVFTRGDASKLQNTSGASTSESGSLVGQSDGNAIKDQTMQDAEDDKNKQMVEAKEEESADDVVLRSQEAVISIFNLLEEVAHGSQSFRVRLVNGSGGNAGIVCNCAVGGANGTADALNNGGAGGSATGSGIANIADNGNWVMSF